MIKIEVFTQHLQRVQKAQDTLRPLYILCTDEPLLLMEAPQMVLWTCSINTSNKKNLDISAKRMEEFMMP
jgi:hypothetical protein